jgi:hypothetical protein
LDLLSGIKINQTMKNLFFKAMLLISFLSITGCKDSTDPARWNSKQLDQWFEKEEWLNGWNVKPDTSINRREFAISYFNHKDRWDKAFSFLRDSDLMKCELKELIGIAPLSDIKEILEPYNEANDIMFMSVNKIINHGAAPDRFFIFFPDDAHRPGLKDGENSPVRKVVVKVKVE